MHKKFKINLEITATQEDAQTVSNALPVLIKNISPKDFALLQRLAQEKPAVFQMALNQLRNTF